MLDQQDPGSRLADDPDENLTESLCFADIQPCRGLIEEEKVERTGESAGKFDQAPLAGGQQTCLQFGQVSYSGEFQRMVDCRLDRQRELRLPNSCVRGLAPAREASRPSWILSRTESELNSSAF